MHSVHVVKDWSEGVGVHLHAIPLRHPLHAVPMWHQVMSMSMCHAPLCIPHRLFFALYATARPGAGKCFPASKPVFPEISGWIVESRESPCKPPYSSRKKLDDLFSGAYKLVKSLVDPMRSSFSRSLFSAFVLAMLISAALPRSSANGLCALHVHLTHHAMLLGTALACTVQSISHSSAYDEPWCMDPDHRESTAKTNVASETHAQERTCDSVVIVQLLVDCLFSVADPLQ